MAKLIKSIRFDEETIAELTKIGVKLDRKFSWLVNRAVQEFIKKNN
jgi:predicted transcriptional regulator